MAVTQEAPGRAVAHIDLGAVEDNCARLRGALAPGAALCAVVKANGYGHGAAACARAARAGGASWLAVATADEALALRHEGIDARLLVIGPLTPDELRGALTADADLVAWRLEFLDAVWATSAELGVRPRVHVKLDTGMGRLGTKDLAEARALCARAADGEDGSLAGVMTHFATADETDGSYLAEQLQAFAPFAEEIRSAHPGAIAHAANSAATLRDPATHFDLVRCGIAVYGLDPFGQDPAARGLRPALTLSSYVSSVKRFAPGESAGYGRRWRATSPTWVGVLPIGYADGWRRGLTNRADALIGGRRRPLVGTVSMDSVMVDLGPETGVEPGEPAVLIGAQGAERILCEEVARSLDTINYEVTCGLGPRVRRSWRPRS